MTRKITSYPLCWPHGRRRTRFPEQSLFKTTQNTAQNELLWALDKLGAERIIISTNIELRKDGLPYANRRVPSDKGVAVYFEYDGNQMCFACDRWDKIGDNMRAIGLTIEALRGIKRWGSGDMMKAAFTGFTALPAPISNDWRQVLGLSAQPTWDEARIAYHRKAKTAHPDNGGSDAEMAALNAAFNEARKELGG